MVVDLAVDGENYVLIGVGQGLCAGFCSSVNFIVVLPVPGRYSPTPTILNRSWHRTIARGQYDMRNSRVLIFRCGKCILVLLQITLPPVASRSSQSPEERNRP